jgi:hypothetical protein
MNDSQFLQGFEQAHLPTFKHYEHIRMAWLYLRRDGWETGYQHIQNGLKHLADAHGQSNKYHETITRFWAQLVYHCIQNNSEPDSFDSFIRANSFLVDKQSISKHYSQEHLFSAQARATWQEPDLLPMP